MRGSRSRWHGGHGRRRRRRRHRHRRCRNGGYKCEGYTITISEG